MEFEFRNATIHDISSLINLGLNAYGQFKDVLTEDNWNKLETNLKKEEIYKDILDIGYGFLCLKQDTVIGMAFLIPRGNPTAIFDKEWSYIRMVGVHPEFRGHRIARTLTEKCIEKARSLNETRIALHTSEMMDAARHIYEKLGFVKIQEIEPIHGKKYWLYTRSL